LKSGIGFHAVFINVEAAKLFFPAENLSKHDGGGVPAGILMIRI